MLADLYEDARDIDGALRHLRHILTFKAGDQGVAAKVDALSKLHPTAAVSAAARPAIPLPAQASGARPAAGLGTSGSPGTGSAKRQPSRPHLDGSLNGLTAESGVRGAVVADAQGRVVINRGLDNGVAEIFAALAAEVASSARGTLKMIGQDALTSWVIEADSGQVIAFQRDPNLTLAILADSGVRAALLELRARQALIDLGAL